MHIPRVVCIVDRKEMAVSRSGVVVEMIADWGSYYKIAADEYMCKSCNAVVCLPAEKPIVESYEKTYNKVRPDWKAEFADQ